MTRVFSKVRPDKSQQTLEEAILTKVNRWIGEGVSACKDIHDRVEENNRYIAGQSQWREGDIERQEAKGRPFMPMNKVMSSLNAIANREIMDRYMPKVYGRSIEDQGSADICDEFLRWQRDQTDAEHEESMVFRSNVASGYGCLHKYWDPLEDEGAGMIVDEEVPLWWMLWDSRARKQDLVDRRWHVCGKYISKSEGEEEYGDVSRAAKKLFKKIGLNPEMDMNVKSTQGRWPWESVAQGRWYNSAEQEIFVVEAEWRDVAVNYRAAIPDNFDLLESLVSDPEATVSLPSVGDGSQPDQQPQQLTGADYAGMMPEEQTAVQRLLLGQTTVQTFDTFADLDSFIARYFDVTGEDFQDYAKDKKYVYKYAVVCAGTLLENGERPQGFTYEFMTGIPFATRDSTTFIGFVDLAKGPQDWRNTFMSLVLTRLAHSPKQSILIEESAIDDVDTFLDQLANPRGAAIVPDGFVSGGRFQLLQPPTFPPFERELLTIADTAVSEQAGLSSIDTASQGDLRRIANTVVQSAKSASNTILALFFDSLRRFRRRSGKLTLRYMYQFYTPEQVARIVGEDKSNWLPDPNTWPDIQRYDIKVDEAPTSVTEQIEFFDFLTRTGTLEKWVDQDRIPFNLVLKWMPYVTESDRAEIKAYSDQQNQSMQLLHFLQSSKLGSQLLQQFQQLSGGSGGAPNGPAATPDQPQTPQGG